MLLIPFKKVAPLPAKAPSVSMVQNRLWGAEVSEETAGAESAPEGPGAGVDPVAIALALGGASQERADAFLRKQEAFIDDQRHHLREQFKQLCLGTWEKRLGVFLRIATLFIGLAMAAGAAWFIWNAASSNDLVIDAFQVPPDLASHGLSGPVVAAKLSDKIAAMQAKTVTQRSPKSYANGLSEGLKLEIPETGVSLSELDRFLREKLGHDLHIGGEMVQTGNGIALTARIGADGSATVTGAEADMDGLLQKLAERVYRITQPYRFATWLGASGAEERVAVLKELAETGPSTERAWAYNGLGLSLAMRQSDRAGRALLQQGLALDPNHYLLRSNLAADDNRWGHSEDDLRGTEAALALLSAHGRDYSTPDRIEITAHGYRSIVFFHRGDLLQAAEEDRLLSQGRVAIFSGANTGLNIEIRAALHEPVAARAESDRYIKIPIVSPNGGPVSLQLLRARMSALLAQQDWPGVLAAERDFAQISAQYPGLAELKPTFLDPSAALALAHMRQFAAAEVRLKPMPADCYPCLIARAQVAALQGQAARADFWFSRAAAIGPSLPFAESEWGRALLDRSKPDAAIAQFTIANQKGPHFADPLEGWGEALMAKNQSHLAVAKFAEAEKYAPNWGRLHLKWGEALVYSGRADQAKGQFARARQLDLTPAEKAELSRQSFHA
jgi:tetratricopeptide (TPR) repeat protein